MEERLLNCAEKLMKKKQLPLSNTPGIRIKNEPASNANVIKLSDIGPGVS